MNKWRGNPWAALVTVSLGFFMTLLDLTIVVIAIPNMIAKLGASLDGIAWVVNAYVIVLAVLILAAGRLGDRFGRREMFVAGVMIFTVASIACGLSQNVAELVTARVAQGIGAALLLPQTMGIIIAIFPPGRRGTALGIWGAVAGLATVAGPTIGGLLVTWFDWRWIFFINLPIGIVVLALARFTLPDTGRGERRRLDLSGVAVASAGLVCIAFGLVEGQRYDWGKVWSFISIPVIFIAGTILLAAFLVLQARRQDREALVPFVLFRDRNFALMNVVNALIQVSVLGMFLPLTIYLQDVLGFSALRAGLTLAPVSVATVIVAPVAGRLVDRAGGRSVLAAGLCFFAAGLAYLIWAAAPDSGQLALAPGMVLCGVGMGAMFGPMQTIATFHVDPRLAGAASGVLNTIRQLGAVLGSAMAVAVLQNRLAPALTGRATESARQLPPQDRQAFVQEFSQVAKGRVDALVGGGGGLAKSVGGLSGQASQQVSHLADQVFGHGYIAALRPTLGLAAAAVLLGVPLCLAVRRTVVPATHAVVSTERQAELSGQPSEPGGWLDPDPAAAYGQRPRM